MFTDVLLQELVFFHLFSSEMRLQQVAGQMNMPLPFLTADPEKMEKENWPFPFPEFPAFQTVVYDSN